jgi:predicted ATPase
MFDQGNRYSNFGDVLMRMRVQGFRCHSDTIVEIESPITAFCGLNGTGKSTLLQLAAAAYKSQNPYYIKDFMVVGTLDPNPFTDNAAVEYGFWQDDRSLKPLTISRNAMSKRWQGYGRRPQRRVLFAGFGLYLPRIERRDFIVRNARQLIISTSTTVIDFIKDWTCMILGQKYENIFSNTVTYFQYSGEIASINRRGITYSESHMGYGEGRSHYLVKTLETLPVKSLVLIEEPETSLHPSAQYEFGRYLIDVVMRKKHQILVTTHSEFILEALPSDSRIYLNSTNTGINTIPGLTSLQAKSLMSQGHVKALHVLVEDECARVVLAEILRMVDPDFLRSIGIHPAGDSNTIAKTVQTLRATKLPVVAVRDADMGDQPSQNIFRLPGSLPPEKELFGSGSVKKYLEQTYGVNLNDFSATLSNVDHHEWFARLADYVNQNESALIVEVAKIYASSLSESDVSTLTALLKEASRI